MQEVSLNWRNTVQLKARTRRITLCSYHLLPVYLGKAFTSIHRLQVEQNRGSLRVAGLSLDFSYSDHATSLRRRSSLQDFCVTQCI
jgi:hypothetical protein